MLDFFAFEGCILHTARNALLHFQSQCNDLCVSLGRKIPVEPIQAEMAADGCKESKEISGALRRNGFPCLPIGIAYALFRILPIVENSVGQHKESFPVEPVRFLNCLLISDEEQVDDFHIVHACHTLSLCPSP